MFFDQAKIHVAAGNGGNGCISFRREKHVPRGGPNGGDGGRGGDVVLVADPQARDLQRFSYKIHFKADAGQPGRGSRKHGADGQTVHIPVPLGTQVWAEDRLVADLVEAEQQTQVARGGSGGRGNARFATSVRQAPKFAELGEEGESLWLRLTLKLMADAGLAGLPNAGKSSLLRRLSNAKPKVAAYPFTTLEPMLGVVEWSEDGDSFILADVPGLLEGASTGVGLGHEFLSHLERCRLILHVVDITGYYGARPLEGFRTILAELDAHGLDLGEKPQMVLLNKTDVVSPDLVSEQESLFVGEIRRLREEGHPAFSAWVEEEQPPAERLVWPVSVLSGAGLRPLIRYVGRLLRDSPALGATDRPRATAKSSADGAVTEPSWGTPGQASAIDRESGHVTYRPAAATAKGFAVRREAEGFFVEGRAVRRLVTRFDLTNEEAIRYLGERLDRLGVNAALRAQGAQPGDDVDIEGHVFEFQ